MAITLSLTVTLLLTVIVTLSLIMTDRLTLQPKQRYMQSGLGLGLGLRLRRYSPSRGTCTWQPFSCDKNETLTLTLIYNFTVSEP